MKLLNRGIVTGGLFLAGAMALSLVGGCIHGHGDVHYDQVDVVDAHGYHHAGYYDEHHDWHGGYEDEHHVHHDDPHDWHQ